METQKTPNSQSNLKNRAGRNQDPCFQTILHSYSNQNTDTGTKVDL